MAEDKKDKKADSIGTSLMKGGVVLGLVAVPAFGGQVLSAVAKAKIDMVGDLAESALGEILVDGVASAAIAGVELGIAAAMGGKKGFGKTLPFALGGVLMSALLPALDRGIDAVVGDAFGDDNTAPPSKQLKPGGAPELGYSLPGGAPELGYSVPGGAESGARGNAAY